MRQRRAYCFNILSNRNVTHLKLEIDKIIKIEKVLIPLKILTNSHSYQNVNSIMNLFFLFFCIMCHKKGISQYFTKLINLL